jgi:CDP-paratose 2-epimerase
MPLGMLKNYLGKIFLKKLLKIPTCLNKKMKYKKILITGGAGFVGSSLSIKLKQNYEGVEIIALDNLSRRGSELNLPRLKENGVDFIFGDVRNKEDLNFSNIDLLIECSAEPSVMAGINSSPEYLLNTNLVGAINCFELARTNGADIIFLSSSRVYPIKEINSLKYKETKTRFELSGGQVYLGVSQKGISEDFPLGQIRSLYGATKLCAEFLLQEYHAAYGIKTVVNRFGVITGPWQMGKVDQGVIVLWMARHFFKKPLSYIGYNGTGKQVRDLVNIDDVFDAINLEIKSFGKFDGGVFNIGGGRENSVSLCELSDYCRKITKNKIPIGSVKENRQGDIRIYLSDASKFSKLCGWKPKKNIQVTLNEIYNWISDNKSQLEIGRASCRERVYSYV